MSIVRDGIDDLFLFIGNGKGLARAESRRGRMTRRVTVSRRDTQPL